MIILIFIIYFFSIKEKEELSIESPTILPSELEFGHGTTGDWNVPLGYLVKGRNDWNPIGVMWERGLPGMANWQQIEPIKGQYNWSKIDGYIKGAQEKNIQTLMIITPFTDWDQETCNMHLEWQSHEGGKEPRDGLSVAHRQGKPCDMEAYKEFLRKLIERYDGDGINDMLDLKYSVTHWEIGNEPDVGQDFFQGSDEDYFEILKTSYLTIKETDPNAKVLIAAIGTPGSDTLPNSGFDVNKLYELGAADYFDIMNTHSFGNHKAVREFLEEYGAGDKPTWVTEPTGLYNYQWDTETEEELVLNLVQVFLEGEKYGVTVFFVGGSETEIPIFQKAINYIKSGGETFGNETKKEVERKIADKWDCNALYEYYNTGLEMKEYAEAIKEDCENACGFTNEMNKGQCYAFLTLCLYENEIWIGDKLCEDMLTGNVQDWCYAHATVALKLGDVCDKIENSDIKEWCINPPA